MLSNIPFEIPPYLLVHCKDLPRIRMAVAGADHPITLESVRMCANAGLIDPILIGSRDAIRSPLVNRFADNGCRPARRLAVDRGRL